jgi:predicted DNA-binding transcriptional regulator AlpA
MPNTQTTHTELDLNLNDTTQSMKHPRNAIIQIQPRGLSRTQAAAYVGISSTLFDELVKDGRMPKPKQINTRVLWDLFDLNEAFDALPNQLERNPWDDVVG